MGLELNLCADVMSSAKLCESPDQHGEEHNAAHQLPRIQSSGAPWEEGRAGGRHDVGPACALWVEAVWGRDQAEIAIT